MQHSKAAALLLLALFGAAGLAPAQECIDFKWDVRQERALFTQRPIESSAGTDLKSAPALLAGHLYRLRLKRQAAVTFEVTPATKGGTDAFAGTAVLKIPMDGSYRVAVEVPLWIDVASNGALLPPKDYQAQYHCTAPHKIVVFEMAAAERLVLQISSSPLEAVLLTLTPVPTRSQ